MLMIKKPTSLIPSTLPSQEKTRQAITGSRNSTYDNDLTS